MKKYYKQILLLSFIIIATFSKGQNINYIKNFNYGNYGFCTSMIEGQNGGIFADLYSCVLIDSNSMYVVKSYSYVILHINSLGEIIDSLKLDNLLGYKKASNGCKIYKSNNEYILNTLLEIDTSNRLMYFSKFDESLNISHETIIDTLNKGVIISTIKNIYGNYVILVGDDRGSFDSYSLVIYEIDSNFNLIKKYNTQHIEAGTYSMVDMPIDSSYMITTPNFIMKVPYSMNKIDTLILRYDNMIEQSFLHFNATISYNDSCYIENAGFGKPYPSHDDNFCLIIRNKLGEITDTTTFGMINKSNWATNGQFMDFISQDTLFYCGTSDYKDMFAAEDSWIAVYKMNIHGDIYWQKYFGYDANYYTWNILATSDGGCVVHSNYWDWRNEPEWRQNTMLMKLDKNGNSSFGINDNINISNHQILVYPNPATNTINFETGFYKNLNLQIYNINGQMQTEIVLKQGKNSITISNYSNGMFFYQILNNGKLLESGKFIKE